MDFFKASVQYGDWHGTVGADDADVGVRSIPRLLQQKGQIEDDEFLIGAEVGWIEPNLDNADLRVISVRAFLLKGYRDFDSVRKFLSTARDPIPVREVKLWLNSKEFVSLFKQFSLMLTWDNLPLENREFSIQES